MAWIESHQEILMHPKTFRLCGIMKWSQTVAIGILHRFWWWCVDHAEDGDLRKYSDGDLAVAVGLNSDDGKQFVRAMVAACWLDQNPYFRVHDWWDYAGKFLQGRHKNNPAKWKAIKDAYTNGVLTTGKTDGGVLTAIPVGRRGDSVLTMTDKPSTDTSGGVCDASRGSRGVLTTNGMGVLTHDQYNTPSVLNVPDTPPPKKDVHIFSRELVESRSPLQYSTVQKEKKEKQKERKEMPPAFTQELVESSSPPAANNNLFAKLCDEFQKLFIRQPLPQRILQDPDELQIVKNEIETLKAHDDSVLIDTMLKITKRNREKDGSWTPASILYFLPIWKKLPKPCVQPNTYKPPPAISEEERERVQQHLSEFSRLRREKGLKEAMEYAKKHSQEKEELQNANQREN